MVRATKVETEQHKLMETNDAKTDRILDILENSFRSNSAQLEEMEQSLSTTLHRARNLGMQYGSLDDCDTNWRVCWDRVEESLHKIILRVREMEGSINSDDPEHLTAAMAAWKGIQDEDQTMVATFEDLRSEAINMNATARKDWILVAQQLEVHLETIYACARALRIKLEWSKKRSREDVEHLVQSISSRRTLHSEGNKPRSADYVLKYQTAVDELEQERHAFFGIPDGIKTLFQFFETPEERVRSNEGLSTSQL